MSVSLPVCALVFGSVAPPQSDVLELTVHLGATKEVSSFNCLLKNYDKKYSPSGTYPINVGDDGSISVGRGVSDPLVATVTVEEIQALSNALGENHLRVLGRCWGERLFRRVVTKEYESQKGEAIIRDVIDYFVGLSHVRTNSVLTSDAAGGQEDCVVADGSIFSVGMLVKIEDDNAWEYNEVASVLGNTVTMVNNLGNTYTVAANGKVWIDLIEKTDTTYTKLEYENTPVFDILKYIAETADKAGVIGYDFRVASDGKFEFFPRESRTSSVSLSERLEVSEYRKSIFRKRDRIYVYGAAEKKYPGDGDAWTETLDVNNDSINDWQSGTGTGSVSLATDRVAVGTYSIKHTTNTADYYGRLRLIIPSGYQPNLNKYPSIQFQINRESAFTNQANVILQDNTGKFAQREFIIPQEDQWHLIKINVGKKYENEWNSVDADFNWEMINEILWDVHFPGTGTGSFWVDNLFFNNARWSATYGSGSRELAETDEELHSDNECLLRAKALYDYLSGTAEYLKVSSSVIDYGTTPILAGDKIWVTLLNENVDGYYRVISVEYHLRARDQTLEVTLELGKEPMLLADYLYALRSETRSLSRYKIGRV